MHKDDGVPLHVDCRGFWRSAAVIKDVETDGQPVDCVWAFLTVSGIGEIAEKERHSVRAGAATDVELECRVKTSDGCATVEIIDDGPALLAASCISQESTSL